MHARISVRGDSVMVEDLHSTNGVYVNGVRITHSALLCEGDRLLTGTTEISLFEARRGARVAPLRARREPTQQPWPEHEPRGSLSAPDGKTRLPAPTTLPAEPRASFGKLDLHLDALAPEPPSETRLSAPPTSEPAELFSLRRRSPAVPSTARADALAVIGALAERLAASGNLDEACRVLSSHLKRILQGATAGLTVPEEVCALAARHSLSLARWTGQSVWINYVVELHLAARRSMAPLTFTAFENAALLLGAFDRQLFSYYIASLRDEGARLSSEERLVLERASLLCKA